MGHQADRALHAGVRPGQLGLRFHHLLRAAGLFRRRRGAVPDRLVHRVDDDANTGGLLHPHAAAVLSQQAVPVPDCHEPWRCRRRDRSAACSRGAVVRLRGAAAAVLRLPDRRDLAYLALVEVTKVLFYRFMGKPMIGTRMMPRQEHHRSGHTGWLRAAVMGADDGILSTASLVLVSPRLVTPLLIRALLGCKPTAR